MIFIKSGSRINLRPLAKSFNLLRVEGGAQLEGQRRLVPHVRVCCVCSISDRAQAAAVYLWSWLVYHYMVDIVVRLVRMPADTAESCWLCYFCIVKHLCSGDKEDDILFILHFYDLSINLLSHKTTRSISLWAKPMKITLSLLS